MEKDFISKRVIYNGFNDEQGMAIDYLHKTYGWEPVLILAKEHTRPWYQENYKDVVFADIMELRLGRFDYGKRPPVPIDKEILANLSCYERSCYSDHLMEDSNGWNFSFVERRQFYFEMLRYWNTVIQHLKPDIFVSWSWPHTIPDYVLYLLCKHHYNIPTVFSDCTPYLENYSACHDELENLPSIFEEVYNSTQHLELTDETKKYLANIRANVSKDPKHITEFNIAYKYSYLRTIFDLIKKIPFAFKKQTIAFKHNRYPWGSPKSQMNYLDYDLWRLQVMIKNEFLYKLYSSYTKEMDFNKKYILFPASYQPEATTCPQGGAYDDLFLVLDLLSASVPKDWLIYYKEYPKRHLQTYHKLSLYRNKQYYERIASLKNVQMIPEDMNTSELIDHAQAVATVTGTVGWEAVVRGKPVLIFGSVWYGGCKSIFKIETYQDCLEAINKIRNGYKPDQVDVERYAAAIEQSSHKLFIHGDFYRRIKSCSDKKFEMERIAKAMYERYVIKYSPSHANV